MMQQKLVSGLDFLQRRIVANGFLVVMLAIGCVGCKSPGEPREDFQGSAHPKVTRESNVVDVYFHGGSASVSAQQRKMIKEALSKATDNSPVYVRFLVNVPQTHGDKPLLNQRVEALRGVLHREGGVARHRMDVHYLSGQPFPDVSSKNRNMVAVVVDQYIVTKPDCPPWEEMGSVNSTQTEKRFGCITERNLVTMVAEPRDLYEGKALGPRDAAYNAGAIEKYRMEGQAEKTGGGLSGGLSGTAGGIASLVGGGAG